MPKSSDIVVLFDTEIRLSCQLVVFPISGPFSISIYPNSIMLMTIPSGVTQESNICPLVLPPFQTAVTQPGEDHPLILFRKMSPGEK